MTIDLSFVSFNKFLDPLIDLISFSSLILSIFKFSSSGTYSILMVSSNGLSSVTLLSLFVLLFSSGLLLIGTSTLLFLSTE